LPPNFIGEFQPCFLAAPQQYAWYHISAPNQPSPHIGKKNTLVNTSAFATKFLEIIAELPWEISGFWGRASPEIIAELPWEISGFWGRASPEIIAELPGGNFRILGPSFTGNHRRTSWGKFQNFWTKLDPIPELHQ